MELKEKLKIQQNLMELFDGTNNKSENFSMEESGVFDSANVCMVFAKSEIGKELLVPFIDLENIRKKTNLKYESGGGSKYSNRYLRKIMNIFACFEESPRITTGKDYPMTIENEDIAINLAPMAD